MLRKKVLAAALAAALAFTGAAAGFAGSNVSAEAAAKKTVYQVTKETDDSGTTKYTYNKKGLLKKEVTTYKDSYYGTYSARDKKEVITTTYKYTKKNKIKTATTKDVITTTYYETDKNDPTNHGDSKGTTVETETTVEKYTYNKKGLATKSVATTKNKMTGSYTTSSPESLVSDETEVQVNGETKYIAGYNDYLADGTKADEDNDKAKAYYYVAAAGTDLTAATFTDTSTYTYTDKGNGTYEEKEVSVETDHNYDTTYNVTVYRMSRAYNDEKKSYGDWSAGTSDWSYTVTDGVVISGAARDVDSVYDWNEYTYTDSNGDEVEVAAPSSETIDGTYYQYKYYYIVNYATINGSGVDGYTRN